MCSTFLLPILRTAGPSDQDEKISSHQVTSNFLLERWYAMAVFDKHRMRMCACMSMAALEILYLTFFSTYLPKIHHIHPRNAVASITTSRSHTLAKSATAIPTIQTSPVPSSSLQQAPLKDSVVHSTGHIHEKSLIDAVSNATLGVSSTCCTLSFG